MKSFVEIAQWKKEKLWSYAIWYDFYDFNINRDSTEVSGVSLEVMSQK